MDYHSLKRKELQALCKKHNIPANSANSVLADKLSALLNESQKPITRKRTCMKSSIETTEVGEPAALKRQPKKVRFSPSNDLVEYELRSGEKQKDMITQIKARRKSAVKKVDNSTTVELVDDSAQIPVKLTRSRVHLSGKDVVNNEKRQSRRQAKVDEKEMNVDKESEANVGKVTRSKAHTLKIGGVVEHEESRQSKRLIKDIEKASYSVEETVVSPARATRSKAQALTKGGTGPDVNPRVKTKSGKQVEKDGKDVDPSKEIMDIPVRSTRSRKQRQKENIGNIVTKPQADMKRTRREMKATDLRRDSSHVAPADKQEPSKRKSLRIKGMKAVDEDEGDKVGVVDEGRVTRSRTPLKMEASGRNGKNIAKVETQQLEEPSKHGGKKNVKRRKFVLQPEKTEVVLHLEEPANRPARKNTRRKSVVQKATKMVESPTVVKKQSKGQSGNLSMIVEGLDDKENVVRTGKDASENESKEVISGNPKSRKRRGAHVIEEQSIETQNGSLVDESPKNSTCSASKSGGKSVAKEQVEGRLKKPVSTMNNQSSLENASKGKSRVARSSSKKRAKLSGTKPSDSEDHDVNSNKEETFVAKLGNINLDAEVIEPEVTPVIDKSNRRFTRSTVTSQRKEPSQSANKQSSSKKRAKLSGKKSSDSEDHDVNSNEKETLVAKLGNDNLDEEVIEPEVTPVIDKSNRRLTRSTIRSEREEPSQSANKQRPIADTQLFSPELTKIRPDLAVNTTQGRITRRGIKHGGNAAISFSEKAGKKKQASQLAHKIPPLDDAQMASPEVAVALSNPDVATIEVRSEIKQPLDEVQMFSPQSETKQPCDDVQMQPCDDVQMRSSEGAEVWPNPVSDAVEVESATSKEVEGQILGNLSVSDSVRLPSKVVVENTISASGTSTGMESASLVPKEKASGKVMEDPGACVEKSIYEASATPCLTENLVSGNDDDHMRSPEGAEVRPNPVSDAVEVESVTSKEVESHRLGDLSASDSVRSPSKVVEENTISVSGTSTGMESVSLVPKEISGKVMEDAGACIENLTYEASATPCLTGNLVSGNDDDQMRSLEGAEVRPNPVSDAVGVESVTSKEVERQILGDLSASDFVRLPSKVVEENTISASGTSTGMESVSIVPKEKASGKVMEDPGACIEKLTYEASATPCLTENLVSGKQPNPLELQNFDHGTLLGQNVAHIKMTPVSISDGSHVQNQSEEVYAGSGLFSVGNDIFGDCDKAISDKKSGLDTFGTPLIGKGDVSGDGIDVRKGPETGSELSNDSKTYEVPVSGNVIDIECVLEDNNDVQDGESEHVQLSTNDNSVTLEEDAGGNDIKPTRNECTPMVAEVLVQSRDQEPGQVLNVAVYDVPCDTVGPSDSVMNNDAPKAPATSGLDDMDVKVDDLEESVLDINKDVVSSILGDLCDMNTEDDSEQKLTEVDEGFEPNGSGGTSPDMSNEQTKEDTETSRGNDNTLDDYKQATTDNLDSDSGNIMDGGSHIGVNYGESELVGNIKANEDPTREEASHTKGDSTVDGLDSSQLMGGIGAPGSLTTKESLPIKYKIEGCPVDDTDSDLPNIEEDDTNKQEETRKASTSVDWGDYDFGMDEFEEPVSASRSAVVVGKGNKDDQDSDLQTSARTNISIEESSGLGVGLANSARNLEDSKNEDGGKPKQDVDMLKERVNADMTEEGFNCSDSSLKALFTTPLISQSNHVKDDSSPNPRLTTPATAQTSHVKDTQEDAANHYSSLKSLFTTCRTSNVDENKTDSVNSVDFTFPYRGPSEDMGTSGTVHREIEIQGDAVRGPENEMYGIPSFEDFPLKLDGNEEVVGSIDRSGRNTNFEFKGDQVDQIKQFEFLSEPAETSHHALSGLKDNSIHSRESEKKEETVMKGSETDDDLAFDTGHA